MLESLQKNKKVYSIVFLVVSVLLFTPVLFLVNNTVFRILIAAMLLIHVVLAMAYSIKGIAIAAMWMVYYLLFLVGVAFSVLLSQYIKLPTFLDNHLFTSAGTMIVMAFIVVIPLPKIVKERIENRLEEKEKETTMEEIMAKRFGVQKRVMPSVGYDMFHEYKSAMTYADKSYSLANSSGTMSTLRIVIGVGFAVLGIIGIVVGPNVIGEAKAFGYLLAFWITLASILVFITGAVIVLFGFLRAFIGLLGMSVLLVMLYLLYTYLQNVFSVSIWLFAFMTSSIFVVAGVIVWIVFQLVLRNQTRTFTFYIEDDCDLFVDGYLEDVIPVLHYSQCLKATIQFDKEINWIDLDDFNGMLLKYSAKQKLIYAGAVLKEEKRLLTIYIYLRSARQEEKIRRFLAKKIQYPIEIEVMDDLQWQIYKTVLLPKEETLIQLYNQRLIQELEANDFDFSEKVPVIFTAVFEQKENAVQFKVELEQYEYEKIVYEDYSKYAAENGLLQKYYHQVHVQKTMKLSEAWLDIETLTFSQRVKQAGGEYEFFTLGELESNISSEDDTQ